MGCRAGWNAAEEQQQPLNMGYQGFGDHVAKWSASLGSRVGEKWLSGTGRAVLCLPEGHWAINPAQCRLCVGKHVEWA